MKTKIMAATMAGSIMLSACSSIIEGRSQELVINTNPPGATCTLVRNDMPIGTVTPTPSAILIEKTKHDIFVKCNKEGYQEATYFNHSGAAGATVGNIILGGGIGWAIDSATGSDNKYDSPLNITLVPIIANSNGNQIVPQAGNVVPTSTVSVSTENPNLKTASKPIEDLPQQAATSDANDFPTGKR